MLATLDQWRDAKTWKEACYYSDGNRAIIIGKYVLINTIFNGLIVHKIREMIYFTFE